MEEKINSLSGFNDVKSFLDTHKLSSLSSKNLQTLQVKVAVLSAHYQFDGILDAINVEVAKRQQKPFLYWTVGATLAAIISAIFAALSYFLKS